MNATCGQLVELLVTVTKVMVRGTSDMCRCIPCPEGQYVDRLTTRCQPCPAGTVVRGLNTWGVESCIRCGEGLTAVHGSQCVTSCHYNGTNGRQYDFTPLAGYQCHCYCMLLLPVNYLC